MSSVSLLSVQARPARQFGIGNKSRNARPRSSAVMAVSKVIKLRLHKCGLMLQLRLIATSEKEPVSGCSVHALQACGRERLQTSAQQVLALLAATQLFAAPIAGMHLPIRTHSTSDLATSVVQQLHYSTAV